MKYLIVLLCFMSTSCAMNKNLFTEDFATNKNNWDLRDDAEFKLAIDSGTYHIAKKNKNFDSRGCLWLSKEIKNFNTAEDFELSFDISITKQDDIVNQIDFMWGSRNVTANTGDASQLYQVIIAQKYTQLNHFGYQENRKQVGWIYGPKSSNLQQTNYTTNKWFTVKIIQRNHTLTVLINDRKVLKNTITPIAGNTIGIQNCLRNEWQIDNIKIKKLRKGR